MSRNKTTVLAGLIIFIILVIIGFWWFSQKKSDNTAANNMNDPNIIRYLPLGDSFTIGNLVAESDRWPNQLAARYMPGGKSLKIIENPAVSGYTSQDLIDQELSLVKDLRPNFVTILIGANDYAQGIDAQTFENNLRLIVSQTKQNMAKPDNILLVTIPDFAKTSYGADFSEPARLSEGIERFNQIIIKVASDEKLPVADVFKISQKVLDDPELVAEDSLHPSAKQYSDWTDIIIEVLKAHNISD